MSSSQSLRIMDCKPMLQSLQQVTSRVRSYFGVWCWVLLASLSCSSPEPEFGEGRWIEQEPSAVLDVSSFFEEAWVWEMNSEAEQARWTRENVVFRPAVLEGLTRLVVRGETAFIERDVDFDANSIDELRFEISGLLDGRLRLFWAAPDQPFKTNDSVVIRPAKVRQRNAIDYVVNVKQQRRFRGSIGRLRLVLETKAGDAVAIGKLRGIRRRVEGQALVELASHPWKVKFDSEQRHAFVVSPGHLLERQVLVPPKGSFSFSLGSLVSARNEDRFKLTLHDGREEQTLVDQRLAELGTDSQRWEPQYLDLSEWAGQSVSLRFAVEEAGDASLGPPLVAVANPRLGVAEATGRPNVILISLDTLRADRLSIYGHDRETSPHIDRWAKESAVVFEKAVSTAPWTLPAHTSLFTGLDALSHGVNYDLPVPATLVTLAELLRFEGYRTAAITGGGYLDPRFGLGQGFERFRSSDERISAEGELSQNVDRAISWLERQDASPFFLFFHTYEIHAPFRPREPHYTNFGGDPALLNERPVRSEKVPGTAEGGFLQKSRYVVEGRPIEPADLEEVGRRYDSGVRFVDDEIGRLFDALEGLGLASNTLVVITSDHGEGLGEKGLAAHAYLYDFNLLVPLIVRFPDGTGAGQRVSEQVSLVDVMPTLLDGAGMDPQSIEIDGRSLLPLASGKADTWPGEAWSYAASSNWGLSLRRQGRLKYIYNDSAWDVLQGSEELYSIEKDAAEGDNLVESSAAIESLRDQVEGHLATSGALRIQWSNTSEENLTLMLQGQGLAMSRVKAFGLGPSKLEFNTGRRVHWTLAPGERQEVRIEGHGATELRISIVGSTSKPWVVNPAELTEPLELELRGNGSGATRAERGVKGLTWSGVGGEKESVPGYATLRLTPPVSHLVGQGSIDEDLRKQLEALGYLQ